MSHRQVVVLGSTGSIGCNALEVIDHLNDRFGVLALSAHRSYKKLARQVRRFRPRYVAVTDTECVEAFRELIQGVPVEMVEGPDALAQLAGLDQADIVLDAVVGAAGMPAALAAVAAGKRLALANKEALVMAGRLVTETAARTGAEIIPVDSEHSAIFQALGAGVREHLHKIIITASGGPFRQSKPDDLVGVTPQQALAHPTWNMGPKITIDSATMMNKALEIIEARWLFGVEAGQIDVLIHPESIVHSLVEFNDGSVIAQMGLPDMRLPIQYALTYPQRFDGPAGRLNLAEVGLLNFQAPDFELFPSLQLGFEVIRRGGAAGAVVNAANEVAVAAFLDRKIGFTDIVRIVRMVLQGHQGGDDLSVEVLIETDAWARRRTEQLVGGSKIVS